MSSLMIADISEVLLQMGLAASVTETERAIAQEAIRVATAAVKRFLRYDPVQATHTEFYPQNDFRVGARVGVWEADENTAYYRELSGFVTNELQVKHLPIRSITSLKVDYDGRSATRAGSFGSGTIQTEGSDFWCNYDMEDSSGNKVCKDGIIRSHGRWPDVAGSVKIVYVAGYSDAELHGQDSVIDASAILEAVIDEAVRRVLKVYSRQKRRASGFAGPFSSESLGAYSYSQDTSITGRLIGGGMDILPETEQKLMEFQRFDLGVM